MAEHDSFIEEVTEEVRRDKMYALWRKWSPWGGAALAALIIAMSVNAYRNHAAQQAAEAFGESLYQAESRSDVAAQAEAYAALAEKAGADRIVLPRLRAADAFAKAGETDKALAEYDALAAVGGPYGELATLRGIMLRADQPGADLAALADRLTPLTAPGKPWAYIATEFEAGLKLQAGDADAAKLSLRVLIDDDATPARIRARAKELLQAIGGA